jgi:hypothetical protein
MITFKDVTTPTLEGQYWAWLNPLGLLRVVYGGDVPLFNHWTSGVETQQDLSIVGPLNSNFRLLRFAYPYSNEEISGDLGIEFKARTGDVFEIRDGMLVFAVVEGEVVTLYSDEPMPEFSDEVLIDTIVQRGPGPIPKLTVLTRYERIINASNPNIPVVRSVGRVILRQKKRNPLCLSDTNVRTESRIFSNIKSGTDLY